ncbi:MAG: YbhB/YbcL family Raf kinase inhibitor-like protein [Dehalococcoidia bacterium]|nr:YbhB/YbcL family Raf kinase inhibitor-like protein [Dehalococcoidia bacterium]
MSFALTSASFQMGQPIPSRYTCDGENISPPLAWNGTPEATAAFALIMDDPDSPRGVFTHWLLYNLPARFDGLPEAFPRLDELPDGTMQGWNDFGLIGYGGPCPAPGSTHRYRFTLYALDRPLPLVPGASKQDLLDALQAHILAQAELVGTYRRQERVAA